MSRLAVAELLDVFNVREPEDYHRLEPGLKPMFASRLYKALTADQDAALNEMRAQVGLRLHFAARARRGDVPSSLPSEAFLKKIAFYARRTLVTYPFHEVRSVAQLRGPMPGTGPRSQGQPMLFGEITTRRTPHGGEVEAVGRAYAVDPADFDDFLDLLCRARPAIEAGVLHVLPVFPDTHQTLLRYRSDLLPANFQAAGLKAQFEEADPSGTLVTGPEAITALYLPMLADLPFDRVLRVRRQEESAYHALQDHLARVVHRGDQLRSERELLEYLEKIDQGVKELHQKARAALHHFLVEEGKQVAAGAVGALVRGVFPMVAGGLGLLLTPFIARAVKETLETTFDVRFEFKAGNVVKPYLEYRRELRGLAADEFYVPWKVQPPSRLWRAA